MSSSSPQVTGRLADSPGVRIILWAITLPVLLLHWYELEPMVTFRPVDAVVVGASTSRVRLSGQYSSDYYYTPWTFYRYEVNGSRYMGKQDRRVDLFGSPSLALQTATSIQKGIKVRAWYNPLRPDEAVLYREPNLMHLLPWTLGIACLWLIALRSLPTRS
jgi:hypothetical protein